MVLYISGDIGGTNSRLQLWDLLSYSTNNNNQINNYNEQLLYEFTYRSKQYNSMIDILNKLIATFRNIHSKYKTTPITACVLAVAGPVNDNIVKVTNLSWTINGQHIEQRCNIRKCLIVNDFAGIGYGLLDLKPSDYIQLNTGVSVDQNHLPLHTTQPKSCLGAGTGLGECYLTYNGSEYDVWSCEGGHTTAVAHNEVQWNIINHIKKTQNLTHVSVERLISGIGLTNIFDYLCTVKQPHNDVLNAIKNGDDKNAVISQYALSGVCSVCVDTIDTFIQLYGSEAGNLALKTLPKGGIYIAGGIASKIMWAVYKNNQFYNAFIDKGRMSNLLKQVPIYFVNAPQIGLIGSRVLCRRLIRDMSVQEKQARTENKLIHAKL